MRRCVSVWGTACWLMPLMLMLSLALEARAELPGPPRCPPAAAERCVPDGFSYNGYSFTKEGVHLYIEYVDGKYLYLSCSETLTLENSAMPRFDSPLRVLKEVVYGCPAPRGSYGTVFQYFNVSVIKTLRLVGVGSLTGAHLADLGEVQTLHIYDAKLAKNTLAALSGLRVLVLNKVRIQPGELLQLPRSLEQLELTRVGTNVTRDVLERLPALVKLTVRDSGNLSVALGGAMRELELDMPEVHVSSVLSPTLRRIAMFGWAERWPVPWTSCALVTLVIQDLTAEELPARWVSNCADLRELRVVNGYQLRAVHATSLRGARSLQELSLRGCALESLPVGLLDDAVELRVLDLSHNYLKELPGGMFARTHSLQILSLYNNRLTPDVYTALQAVTSLTTLDLSNNVLHDSCLGSFDFWRGYSPLKNLKNLINLHLRATNASMICRDWRVMMPRLKKLDLSRNKFTSLTFTDLQFYGDEIVEVDLSGNDVRSLRYTQHDYKFVIDVYTAPSKASVKLGDSLACDCHTYWAARALQERPNHIKLMAFCMGRRRDLHEVALDSLVCGAPALCASTPGCTCAWRDSGVATPPRLLRVDCERAGLERLSDVITPLISAAKRERVAMDDYDWQLYLAHNRIVNISTGEFPKHLSVLDLRNNSLSLMNEEDVRTLLADGRRRVSLAHNPLACDRNAAGVLATLREHRDVLDYDELTCANGSLLSAMRIIHYG
ncbi:hypothetical protein PYW08_015722 [Mythimna loreyi]|uniref:Uncharacterized protein n=1 Tax=Mythimna loreyi TaxID=667449 RepID=A0ACC2QS39_9NEOP|nr:hypothetical protein PYW08_015722 [Mythimna loreyi]